MQTDPIFYYVTFEFPIIRSLADVRDALQEKQDALGRKLDTPLTYLEKASLKLIETDIVNEEPEKALRLIGRMIESIIALEDSPVAKGPGSDPDLSNTLNDSGEKSPIVSPGPDQDALRPPQRRRVEAADRSQETSGHAG